MPARREYLRSASSMPRPAPEVLRGEVWQSAVSAGAERRTRLTRRDFLKATGVGTVAAGIGPGIVVPGRARAARSLKLLQWTHFVPRYDREWFDAFARTWAEVNGVDVTVDHIQESQIEARASAEVAGVARGHDLIEWVSPPPPGSSRACWT